MMHDTHNVKFVLFLTVLQCTDEERCKAKSLQLIEIIKMSHINKALQQQSVGEELLVQRVK